MAEPSSPKRRGGATTPQSRPRQLAPSPRAPTGPGGGSAGGRGKPSLPPPDEAVADFSAKLSSYLHQVSSEDQARQQEALTTLRQRLQSLVAAAADDARRAMDREVDACVAKLQAEIATATTTKVQPQRRYFFRERVFTPRNSVLTQMLQKPDFQSIYHIFIAIMVWLGVNIVLHEWFENHRFVNWEPFFWAFSKYDVVLPVWVGMQMWSTLIVPFVRFIDAIRPRMLVWMPVYAVYQLTMLIVPSYLAVHYELPPASGFIVMCEMARFFMKSHAYLREKLLFGMRKRKPAAGAPKGSKPPRVFAVYADFVPPALAKKGMTLADVNVPDIDIRDPSTELGRFLYFQFAPTLVYRDSYPTSGPHIDWVMAIVHFTNLCGVLLYTYLIFQTFCVPFFSNTGRSPGDLRGFIESVMRAMMPSMGVFLLMFFGVLHSWFNLWAELLRFGDRQFYTDWWNSYSFGSYYRRWNAVVHEWLYAYLYLDVIRFSLGRIGRSGGMALVFIISAIIHEQIIACAMLYFYPVLLILFGGPGVVFVNLTKQNTRFYNVFLWLMLSVGNGLIMVLYSREWYARLGDQPVHAPGWDTGIWNIVPRSWLAFYQDVTA